MAEHNCLLAFSVNYHPVTVHDVDVRMSGEILCNKPQRRRHVEIVGVDPRHDVGGQAGDLGEAFGDGMGLATIGGAFQSDEARGTGTDQLGAAVGGSASGFCSSGIIAELEARQHIAPRPYGGGKRLLEVPGCKFQALRTSVDALAVWRPHSGRADIENRIKELGAQYGLKCLCCRSSWATEAACLWSSPPTTCAWGCSDVWAPRNALNSPACACLAAPRSSATP